MNFFLIRLGSAILALFAAHAVAQNSDAGVRKAVDDYLRVQIQGLPGKASYTIDSIQTAALPPCANFETSTTPGARTWGRTSVTVRCVSGADWTVLVPVQIRLIGHFLVSARPISPGQVIGETDISLQTGDLAGLPASILSDAAQAIGKISRAALPAGRPLRADMLKAPSVIKQGQSVRVISRGAGFEVANEGKALNNAVLGQVTQVRLPSGQVVSGIATKYGNVEIGH